MGVQCNVLALLRIHLRQANPTRDPSAWRAPRLALHFHSRNFNTDCHLTKLLQPPFKVSHSHRDDTHHLPQ